MKRNLLIAFCLLVNAAFAQNCIINSSCLEFDGTSTYVDIPTDNGLNITDSVTVEAWINSSAWALTPAQGTIVCKHGWFAGEEGYTFRAGGTGELSFNIACDSAGTNVSWRDLVSSPGALQLNTWHHVVGMFTGTESRIYIDGVLAGTRTFGATVGIVSSPDYLVNIGRLADENQFDTRYWEGRIDEVRIWHRILSPAEIIANMNQHIDTATAVDLVGYWRFNEASGTTAADLSGNNNTGTVMSGSWNTSVPFSAGPAAPYITVGLPNLVSSSSANNQWYLNGNIIPGATGQVYIASANGTYTVAVTDTNGCSAISAPVVITTLGISETNAAKWLTQSYVNGNKLSFGFPEAILANSELRIVDATGRLVFDRVKGQVHQEVMLDDLNAGVYIVFLTTLDKKYSQKIVLR